MALRPFLRAASRIDRATSRAPCEHILRACLAASLVALAACGTSAYGTESSESETTTAPPVEGDRPSPPDRQDPVHETAEGVSIPTSPASMVTPAAILAKLAACTTKVSKVPYARDVGGIENVDVCSLGNAVFWRADLDVDCDGTPSDVCNVFTDPSYQSQTASIDSHGAYLDAAKLPYIVVPSSSARWNYKASDIALGSVALVIYDGKMEFGIVGDVGPSSILGEASYAMAKSLGINPDPKIGGTSAEVLYVVFTGPSAIVKKKEDHGEAVSIGTKKAEELLSMP
jgi:hypothetical protein